LYKAQCLAQLKQYEKALEAYDRYLVLDPLAVDGYIAKGDTLTQLKRYMLAYQAYLKAYELEPKEAIQGKLLAAIRSMESGTPESVLAIYEALLKRYPKHVVFLISKASYLQNLQRYEEALATYEVAFQLDPNEPSISLARADIQNQLALIARQKQAELEKQRLLAQKAEQERQHAIEQQRQVEQEKQGKCADQEGSDGEQHHPQQGEASTSSIEDASPHQDELRDVTLADTNVHVDTPVESRSSQQKERISLWKRIFKAMK
jgi:tetratricopeptide (TPR) repeat protein